MSLRYNTQRWRERPRAPPPQHIALALSLSLCLSLHVRWWKMNGSGGGGRKEVNSFDLISSVCALSRRVFAREKKNAAERNVGFKCVCVAIVNREITILNHELYRSIGASSIALLQKYNGNEGGEGGNFFLLFWLLLLTSAMRAASISKKNTRVCFFSSGPVIVT